MTLMGHSIVLVNVILEPRHASVMQFQSFLYLMLLVNRFLRLNHVEPN